jgi:hypothetical protein
MLLRRLSALNCRGFNTTRISIYRSTQNPTIFKNNISNFNHNKRFYSSNNQNNENDENSESNLLGFAISGAVIFGCFGFYEGLRSNSLRCAFILGAGGALVGAVFVPSLSIPFFWPIYVLLACVIYTKLDK